MSCGFRNIFRVSFILCVLNYTEGEIEDIALYSLF